MKTAEFSLKYRVLENLEKQAVAIVLSGGKSTRMNGINKQFSLIGGIPVIARSLLAFEQNNNISAIVVATREQDILKIQQLAEKYNISKLSDIVVGGNSRADSVKNAFNSLSEQTDAVLIHDGARPLVSQEVINNVVSALDNFDGAAAAVSVNDTIKAVDGNGKITETLVRDSLRAMQTPQGFKYSVYKNALENAENIGKFTDDCALVESAGYNVYVVKGDNKNIKITTQSDLIIANAFLKEIEND